MKRSSISLCSVLAVVLTLSSARAQIVVNSTGDESRFPYQQAICDTDAFDGVNICTLRAAIQTANLDPDAATITFQIPTSDPGYNAQTGSYTINLLSALPDLSTQISISGPGASVLTVQRSSSSQFRIFNVTTTGTVNFSGITIANGAGFNDENGGAIQNANGGTVNLTDCVLTRNSVSTAFSGGGGLYNNGGVVTFTRSILDQQSAHHGGAIYNNSGTMTLTECTLDLQQANQGAGIYNNLGTATIVDSTLRYNSASISGGGVYNAAGATLNVRRCAILLNSADAGGGIANGGAMNVVNTTIALNDAYGIWNSSSDNVNITNSTIAANTPGGIDNESGTVKVKSTIIALNNPDDVRGTFLSKGFNLVGQGGAGSTAATDLTGTPGAPLNPGFDPNLSLNPVRDNGGPTQTIALRCDSPAVDNGTSAGLTGSLTTDQRDAGFQRAFDDSLVANAVGGDGTDIGAFERQSACIESVTHRQ